MVGRHMAVSICAVVLTVAAGATAEPMQTTSSMLLPVSERIETSSTKAWRTRCAQFAQETTVPKGGVVLLGDSITARWPAALFPEPAPINRGIGSDHIGGWKYYGVLDRLDTAIDIPAPRRVYLMIGINDMLKGGPPMGNMVAAYRELLREIKRRAPQATVIVQSVLPVRGKLDYMNGPVVELNRELPKLAAEAGYPFVDLHRAFRDAKGEMRAELTSDGVHLNRDGYKLWADELRRQVLNTSGGKEQMRARVRRESGRVWIEGVPEVGWGAGKDITFIGCLESALNATDRPYKYSDLMGWSGLAFRLRRFEGDRGQMGSTSDGVGESSGEFEAIEKATGWHLELATATSVKAYTDRVDMESFAPAIARSIDWGLPALTYPPHWNVAVICGYENDGKRVLLRDYFKGREEYWLNTSELVPFLILISDRGKPLAPKEALLRGLRIAVDNWKRAPERSDYNRGHYYHGESGFRKWTEHATRSTTGTLANDGGPGLAHSFVMTCLQDARRTGVAFIGDNKHLLCDAAAAELTRVAETMRKEADLIASRQWQKADASEFRAFLDEARRLEEQMISGIEKALSLQSAPPHP